MNEQLLIGLIKKQWEEVTEEDIKGHLGDTPKLIAKIVDKTGEATPDVTKKMTDIMQAVSAAL